MVGSFVAASLVGAGVLSLPVATEAGATTTPLTALFTATSSVTVTGLTVVDTAGHWSTFGEVVILALIQVGGFGIMALSSLILLGLARRLGLRQRLVVMAETGTVDVAEVRRMLVGLARLAVGVEAAVAALLFLRLWTGHDASVGQAAYDGVFHSVSAFNNAGFALFDGSLSGFAGDPVLLVIVAATVVVGGLGFPAWVQIARSPRRPGRWSLHAKITVFATIGLILVGWALFSWFEWTNAATLGERSALDSAVNGLFHSITPRTAGFSSIDMGAVREPTRLLTEALMVIGGGSASTAGGIKVTTFALLGWVMWAEVRGDPDVVVFGRRVPHGAQRQAMTVALAAVGTIVLATMALLATTGLPEADVLFESVSALGTVGLSTGITELLPSSSQLWLIGLMLLGRIGPVTLFAALVLRERDLLYRHPEERPLVG